MAGNDLEVLDILAERVSQRLCDEAVGSTVEAVLSDVQLFVALIGQTVHECLFRHGGMERGIENDYLRSSSGNDLLAGSQCERVRVIMYGSQFRQVVYLLDNLVCNECCLAEYLSALYYSVANSGDLAHAVDDLALACGEYFNKLFKSFGVGRECAVGLYLSSVEGGVLDVAVNADTVTVSLGDNALVLHVDELVLQRGAAGVDNKNLHDDNPFICWFLIQNQSISEILHIYHLYCSTFR